MARPKKLDRPVEKTLSIPESLHTRIELLLFSELEGRVPHGAWSGLLETLLREHLEKLSNPDAERQARYRAAEDRINANRYKWLRKVGDEQVDVYARFGLDSLDREIDMRLGGNLD